MSAVAAQCLQSSVASPSGYEDGFRLLRPADPAAGVAVRGAANVPL